MTLTESLRAHYVDQFPAEAARFVEESPQAIPVVADLPVPGIVKLLERLDPSHLRSVFLAMPFTQQVSVLETASIRIRLAILHSLEEDEREALLAGLPEALRTEIVDLLEFPEDTAGFYMDGPVAQFRTDMSVGETLESLRASKQQRVRSLYLVDENNQLAGRVDMQDMALSTADTRMSTLLNPVEGVAYLTSPREDMVEIFDTNRVDSIPIVDRQQRLIGVVRYASLFQAAEDEATADIQTMVGTSADERALSPATFAVKKRLAWLHINLLTAFLAASVVGLFQSTIAQFTMLAVLMPVVAGQSGNAGGQALAVTMRGLALKEINVMHWRNVLWKEIQIAVIDGFALAATCGLGVFLWSHSAGLAAVIGISMVVSLIAAGIAGALVPIVLVRVGQDPATASTIILTTVTDVSGFMSFLGTATLLSFLL